MQMDRIYEHSFWLFLTISEFCLHFKTLEILEVDTVSDAGPSESPQV